MKKVMNHATGPVSKAFTALSLALPAAFWSLVPMIGTRVPGLSLSTRQKDAATMTIYSCESTGTGFEKRP